MSPEQLDEDEQDLREKTRQLINKLELKELLDTFGKAEAIGSYARKVMVKPDVDFIVYVDDFDREAISELASRLYKTHPAIFQLEIFDHQRKGNMEAIYFGAVLMDDGLQWQLDITFGKPGVSVVGAPEDEAKFKIYFKNMTDQQRLTILSIKHELLNSNRYLGAKSTPPNSFRSTDVYKAVFEGNASSVSELEKFFTT